jgi:PEP-CTERM motif
MNGIPAIHLGRTKMTSRPVFLLCAAFLIAALPVCGDSVFYTGVTSDSPNVENSTPEMRAHPTKLRIPSAVSITSPSLAALAPVWGHQIAYLALPGDSPDAAHQTKSARASALQENAPQIDGQLSDPTPAIASIGGFEPSSSFAAWGSEPSFIVGTLSPPSSDIGVHSTGLVEIGSGDPVSFIFDTDGARHRIGHDRGRGDDGKTPGTGSSTAVLVPEPGALSLALFGLAAVAIFARRRQVPAVSA